MAIFSLMQMNNQLLNNSMKTKAVSILEMMAVVGKNKLWQELQNRNRNYLTISGTNLVYGTTEATSTTEAEYDYQE